MTDERIQQIERMAELAAKHRITRIVTPEITIEWGQGHEPQAEQPQDSLQGKTIEELVAEMNKTRTEAEDSPYGIPENHPLFDSAPD